MRNEELIELISTSRLKEAVERLRSEKTRLTNVSVAHPVFDVLKSYMALKQTGYSYYSSRYGHNDLTPEQKDIRERQLLIVLGAMFDAGTDPHMELAKLSSWTNDQEERSRIGIASTGGQHASHEPEKNTLYSRFAGLGWTGAMDLLLKRGIQQNDKQLSNAVLNTCRMQKQESLYFLLDRHPTLPSPHSYECAKIMSSVMAWKGVDPVCVDRLYHTYTTEDGFDWAKSHNSKTDARTSIEWLSLAPGKWGALHQDIKNEYRAQQKSSTPPALFPALLKEYVQTGDFKDLLKEALSDVSFEESKAKAPFLAGVPLASWLSQGGAFDFSRGIPNSWGLEPKEDPNPIMGKFAQIRRAVSAYRAMGNLAAPSRTPDFASFIEEKTDGMDWASKGWVPTRAFIHRHPEFIASCLNGSSPVHVAKNVETALGWEALGAHASINNEGVDPWVAGMQTAEAPAPWAREIAQRLKDGRLSLDAMGQNGEPLSSIVTRSPPLARAWIKKSRRPLSPAMLAGAIKNNQWPLVCEWLKAGMVDHDSACRVQICYALAKPPAPHGSTATVLQGWMDMASAMSERKDLPWKEQVETWRQLVGAGWPNHRGKVDERPLLGMKVLSQWGDDARAHWEEKDFSRLHALIHNAPSDWLDVLPIQLSMEETVDVSWGILLDKTTSRASRYSMVASLVNSSADGVPLRNAGPGAFERLREINEEAPYSAAFNDPRGFESFLEAEELASATRAVSPPSRPGLGRRL
jgi:hypothetical protein